MAPEERQQPSRYYEIDLLRFGAAMAVVLYHLAYRGYHAGHLSPVDCPTLGRVCKCGYLGVELFFLISGYVILHSAQGKTLGQFLYKHLRPVLVAWLGYCTLVGPTDSAGPFGWQLAIGPGRYPRQKCLFPRALFSGRRGGRSHGVLRGIAAHYHPQTQAGAGQVAGGGRLAYPSHLPAAPQHGLPRAAGPGWAPRQAPATNGDANAAARFGRAPAE
ncbi:MAG: acyltransferase [Hymenobacter sp.]|nr:MAG: acyltransferase [Hymenobacter sp.]